MRIVVAALTAPAALVAGFTSLWESVSDCALMWDGFPCSMDLCCNESGGTEGRLICTSGGYLYIPCSPDKSCVRFEEPFEPHVTCMS
jgi:hypothetical protein